MESEVLVNTVMALVGLLFVAAVSALFLKRIHFPYTVGLVLLGVGIAFLSDQFEGLAIGLEGLSLSPELIMFVFIPILIFESASNINVRVLARNLVPTLVLAAPGLLISTALIGFLVSIFTPLPLGSALLFGCLISATDPVAVIALFKEVGAPRRLNILVEGESLFNDATAIVTFQIILAVLATNIIDTQTVIGGIGDFLVVFFGGLIVGLGFGYLLVLAIRLIGDEPLIHITMTLVVAYGSFILAEHFLHTSGIMAVLGAGLVLGYYGELLYSHRVKEYLEIFWDDAAFVANSLIFLMLGLSEKVFLTNVNSNFSGLLLPVITVILIVLIVRALIVYSLVPLVNRLPRQKPINTRFQTIMYWGGLRGAVAIALAVSIPGTIPFRWQIIDFAFGVTLFTLLVNGTTMSWLMRRLGLDKPTPLIDYTESFIRVLSKKEGLERLNSHQPIGRLNGNALQGVQSRYEQEVANAEAHLSQLKREVSHSPALRKNLMWLSALGFQRKIYHKRYEDGLLGLESLRELEWDLRELELQLEMENSVVLPERKTGESASKLNKLFPQVIDETWAGLLLQKEATFGKKNQQRLNQLYEEVTTLIAAARHVIDQIGHIGTFSTATEDELASCQHYYEQLETRAITRMHELESRFAQECGNLQTRQLVKLAQDGEMDVVHGLGLKEVLPELTAERVEHSLETAILGS